jgi:hypothetical protein
MQILLVNLAAAAGAVVAYLGWPQLGRVNGAYGFAARIPVAVVMLVAMAAKWGTHYELGAPGLPEMEFFTKWVTIGLIPQLVLWIAFTIIVGCLFGSIAAAVRARARAE